jgi:O-antigen ligase
MKNYFSLIGIFVFLLSTIAFFIPVLPKILPGLIITAVIVWFILVIRQSNSNGLITDGKVFLLLFLYCLYVAGMFYTINYSHGLKDLETKLSLLVFPLIFSTVRFPKADRTRILLFFLAGCFTAMAYNIINSAYNFYTEYSVRGSFNYTNFLYFNLSQIIHPSYLALYFCLAVSIIIDWIQNQYVKLSKYLLYFALLCLIIFIFMLSSKAGILTLITVLTYYLVIFLKKVAIKNLKIKQLLIPAAFIIFSVIMYLFLVPGATKRLEINPRLFTTENVIAKDTEDSSELRVLIWQNAVEIIENNLWFGIGTGDVRDALMRKYEDKHIKRAIMFQLNAHNQFLQTWIAVGIPGLIALLIWLFLLIKNGLLERDHNQIIFGIILFINFLFESMLETQAGVIFISFFTCLFLFSNNSHK